MMSALAERMIGAARFHNATFEDIEHDRTAMRQALVVVVLSSIAAALGTGLGVGPLELVRGTIMALVGWLIWAALTFFVGTKLLSTPQTHATLGQVLRTTGFAMSPGILRVIGVIPIFTGLVFLVTSVWMLMTFVIAVRHALDYQSTWRAVAVCIVGWFIYLLFGIFIL